MLVSLRGGLLGWKLGHGGALGLGVIAPVKPAIGAKVSIAQADHRGHTDQNHKGEKGKRQPDIPALARLESLLIKLRRGLGLIAHDSPGKAKYAPKPCSAIRAAKRRKRYRIE